MIAEGGGSNGAALPAADVVGTLSLAASAGRLQLLDASSAVVDLVGYGSAANTFEGAGPAPAPGTTQSIVRAQGGNTDTNNNNADFTMVALSSHAPFNSASAPHPANGGGATSLSINDVALAEGNAGQTAFTFTVTRTGDTSGVTTVHYATADGAATVADGDYAAASGDLSFAAGVTTQTLTVQVNGDTRTEPNEAFTVALSAPSAGVTFGQQVGTGTITNDDVSVLKIGAVQGASHTSPYVNQSVTVAGAVTQVVSNGFYVQDGGDGNDATSDGVLVFTTTAPTVQVGQLVQVTGVVSEYRPAANTDALTVTQIGTPTVTVTDAATTHTVDAVVIGAGGRLPPTAVIASDNDLSTFKPTTDGLDFYESLAGMKITVKAAQAVDATYNGQTWVVADGGAEATGINARGGITIGAADNNPERIQIYQSGSPVYRMGDHLGDVTGVLTYYAQGGTDPTPGGEYELLPSSTLPAASAAALPKPATTLAGDAGHLSVAAYNVENLDPADPQARFDQLGRDIAVGLKSPDIVSLEEVQDADGPGAGTNYSGQATAAKLIAAIQAAGGPAYTYVEVAPTANNQTGGEPNGNIRNGFLFNAARVGYDPASLRLILDATPGQGTRTGGNAFYNSRNPLLADFTFNGQTVTFVSVHNYSRGGSQELFGANQPALNNGDDVRLDQSTEILNFLNTYKATHPNIVVAGDFNAYQFEPSLTVFSDPAKGLNLTDLVNLQAPEERYSTTFEGNAQQIDNLLVSQSLLAGAQFQTIHVNTGQTAANQASDHDPIVALLALAAANAPVTAANAGGGQAIGDKATVQPFAAVVVADPDAGQTETAAITYAAGAGTLAGAGLTGQAGAYTLQAGSAAALQAALAALTFTPAQNQAPAGAVTTTVFTVQVSDGSATAVVTDQVAVTSQNDAPVLSGLPASVTAPAGGAVVLAPGLAVTDADPGASATGAQVAVTAGFTAGDRLSAGALPTGVRAAFDAQTGVLTLTGAASDADYAAALQRVGFSHDGAVDAGVRTVAFTLTDEGGATSQRLTETVNVAGSVPPDGSAGGGTPPVPTNLSAQQGYPVQTGNLLRVGGADTAASDPSSPLYAQAQAEKAIAAALDAGQIGSADAQTALYHLVDGTTSVAEISYAFFTGRTPTAAGLNYLVHSSANPTDLNDAYYAKFSTENRYINFAANLATGPGAGAAAFQANYGALSLADATTKAYQAVFGFAPAAGKIDAILNAQVSNGLGGTETRAQYFADITGGSAQAQKAAAVGFLLADSVKEGFGAYQQADLHFLQDLAHGTAVFNTDLLAAYAAAPSLVGQPVVDASLRG